MRVRLFASTVGRLITAVLLLLDFLPFYGVAYAMLNEIKCKHDEDKGKEGRMSSVEGDSNLLCCLPYMAATNVGKNKLPDTARCQKTKKVQCARKS